MLPKPSPKAQAKAERGLVFESLRTLASISAAKVPSAGNAANALEAFVLRSVDDLTEGSRDLVSAMASTGRQNLFDRAFALNAARSMILSRGDWARLAAASEPKTVVAQILDKRLAPANAALAILSHAVRDDRWEAVLHTLAGLDHNGYRVLSADQRGALCTPQAAALASAFLTRNAAAFKGRYAEYSKGQGGKGDAFAVVAIHLAGLSWKELSSWNSKLHKEVQGTLEPLSEGKGSAHTRLRTVVFARDLTTFLSNQNAFQAWLKDRA